MSEVDTSAEAVKWPRELYVFQMGEHEFVGDYVLSVHSTIPRWEGDEERERPAQKYVDADIYDSQVRYSVEMINNICLERDTLRAQLAAAKAENDRLNKWADGFSDAQLKERKLCEDRIQEVQRENDRLREDADLLQALEDNLWDLRGVSAPTGGGDSQPGWEVIEHHMAAPKERIVGMAYTEDPRPAIRAALKGGDA
ncbi:hypothetical protein [Thalassobius sp. I31.1]|uniref:hypothetical protein n=1 Tax=Thalassobius sp. I31.1 TaxID=2109912 RepID=UPI000D1B50E8|nr:hypothetical protein [Thalassobius sp. I31.1]